MSGDKLIMLVIDLAAFGEDKWSSVKPIIFLIYHFMVLITNVYTIGQLSKMVSNTVSYIATVLFPESAK